jgi:hypothetical protein
MIKPLTRRTTDHSDGKSFSFSFFCDICGSEWKSPKVPFDTDGMAIEHEEAQNLLWANEHRIAYEQANMEALMHYNLCEKCSRRVCDHCFCFNEKKQIGECKKCC